jgi:hypothetical protein
MGGLPLYDLEWKLRGEIQKKGIDDEVFGFDGLQSD